MDELFLTRLLFNGGAILLAVVCIMLAARREARGALKVLLWLIGLALLLIQAVAGSSARALAEPSADKGLRCGLVEVACL
jgi:hypothetical protein